MKRILYLECTSGISGDMTAAALIDLGADREVLQRALDSIPEKEFRTEISSVKKAGLLCCDFNVITKIDNHDHDMEYLHGHEHADHVHDMEHHHDHEEHHHGEEHHHDHEEHHHDHGEHHHGHSHRSYADIKKMLPEIDMTEGALKLAERTFEIIAKAEAKAHGTTEDEVHFHEVGAIDSIVDIVTCAVCFDNLKIDAAVIPCLYEGGGTIRCQHGILPVPVPAVVNIVEAAGIPLHLTGDNGEFVTPTGAAFAAAVRTGGKLPEKFVIRKTGLGAGKRSYERPSILRAMLIEEAESEDDGSVVLLEANIDDSTGEQLGYAAGRLLAAGALDAFFVPVYMKKNRPAYLFSVIARPCDREKMENIIFEETTTIGIRRSMMERTCLERRAEEVDTPCGKAKVKAVTLGSRTRRYPEYDSACEIAASQGIPFPEAYEMIRKAANLQE